MLFEKIIPILQGMLDTLEKGRKQKETQEAVLGLNKLEEKNFSGKNILYQLASGLDGRYHAFNQAMDPLGGKNSAGSCYGYVQLWAEQIAGMGQYTNLPRNTQENRIRQIQQATHIVKEEKIAVYLTRTDRPGQVIDQLLMQVNSESIYGVNLKVSGKTVSHRIGLRKIPSTSEIEWNDPNNGIFVFKNEQAFKIWFVEFLHHSGLASSGSIRLNKIGTQPAYASASVPSIATDNNETKLSFNFPLVQQGESNKAIIEEKANVFYANIRLAGIYIARKKLPAADAEQLIDEKIRQSNKAYRQFLQQKLNISDEVKLPKETDYQADLKKSTIDLIDTQIKSLPSSAVLQKDALFELKKQITQAPRCMPLEILMNEFLACQSPGQAQNYQEILLTSSENKNFINNLVSHHEISPACLVILQQKLLFEIIDLAVTYPGSAKHQQIITAIKNDIANAKDLGETLAHVKKLATPSKIGFFTRHLTMQGIATNYFYNALNKITPNDPHSLMQTQAQLSQFPRHVLAKNEPALTEKNPLIIPKV